VANGIPALASINHVVAGVVLLAADVIGILNMLGPPQWGIYLNGAPALAPDSIISAEVKADWRLSDYPQEPNAFGTYNKVRTPIDSRVTMTKGGPGIGQFLLAVEAAAASLNLYDVVTPDRVYSSANITHYDYRRNNLNGVSLLSIDLWLEEVRVTGTTASANTQAPSGASPVNGGNVQGQQVTPPGDATPGNVSFIQSQNQSTATGGNNLSPATYAAIQKGVA
jgi:hypothetical protein